MEEIIRKITTNYSIFNAMPDDLKLENICNAIEFLLKKNEKEDYIEINSENYFDLISMN